MNERDDRVQGNRGDGGDSRAAYEKPAVAWAEDLEIKANLASACDKIGGSGEPCDSNSGS